jgi:hypothetical protein
MSIRNETSLEGFSLEFSMIRRIAIGIALLVVIFLPGCDDSSTTPLLFQSLEGT